MEFSTYQFFILGLRGLFFSVLRRRGQILVMERFSQTLSSLRYQRDKSKSPEDVRFWDLLIKVVESSTGCQSNVAGIVLAFLQEYMKKKEDKDVPGLEALFASLKLL